MPTHEERIRRLEEFLEGYPDIEADKKEKPKEPSVIYQVNETMSMPGRALKVRQKLQARRGAKYIKEMKELRK